MQKTTFFAIFNLILINFFTVNPVNSQPTNPNGINNKPAPGWSLWKPRSEAQNADFDSGFSNMELGGYLDFEYSCKTNAGVPENQIQYWFRLSNSVSRLGTGFIESGCWVNGKFIHTYKIPAIKSSLGSVNCFTVTNSQGVNIYSEPNLKSKKLGNLTLGKRVDPGYYPASIIESEEGTWISIKTPVEGWVFDGKLSSEGNFKLCRRKDPNDTEIKPDPGWSLWKPFSHQDKSSFIDKYSNQDVESYKQFQSFCTDNPTISQDKVTYWFRLSNIMDRIGTGNVEYGCWFDGRFIFTQSLAATKKSLSNIHCLKVVNRQGLDIYTDNFLESQKLGRINYGKTVTLNNYPATIQQYDNGTWIAIDSPIKGWIFDGKLDEKGNLSLCKN